MVRIWEQYVRDHPNAKRLPVIVPILLHHSERGWMSPTSFEDLLAVDAKTLPLVAPYVPRFRILLDDISGESDEALRARAMSALGRLALFGLRHGREPGRLVAELVPWLSLVREVQAAPGGREALVLIWRYVLLMGGEVSSERLVEQLVSVVGEESKEEIMTAGEELIERGRKEGLAKGLEKGLAKGVAKGRQQTLYKVLVKQLEARFGTLPAAARASIEAADADRLDQWFDQALIASSLDEALATA